MQNVTNTAPETADVRKKELDGTRDQRTREIRDHHRLSLAPFCAVQPPYAAGAATARDDQRLADWLCSRKRPDFRQSHPDRSSAGSRKKPGKARANLDRAR